jgi:hypothetical protein
MPFVDGRVANGRPIVVGALIDDDFQQRSEEPFEYLATKLQRQAIQLAAACRRPMDDLPAQGVNAIEGSNREAKPAPLDEVRLGIEKGFAIGFGAWISPKLRIEELVVKQVEHRLSQLNQSTANHSVAVRLYHSLQKGLP